MSFFFLENKNVILHWSIEIGMLKPLVIASSRGVYTTGILERTRYRQIRTVHAHAIHDVQKQNHLA
mgnify:CR=1 FL=1